MKLKPASSLNSIRRTKSASGHQTAKLMRLVFLRPYLTGVTFSNTRSASLLRDSKLASLCQNIGLMKSMFFKFHQTNATISNARSASLLSRGMRPAF